MIEVTDLFKEMAQKYYRNVDFKIVSNDDESTVYSGDVILECQINRSVGSSGIQIGNAISDRLQFTLKSTDKIKSGIRLTPYVRYKGEENTEWLRLGRFYCTESKMSNGILTVTAYDRLYSFDKRCAFGGRDSIQALSFPATHQQMWDYVCALRGVESDFQCADFTVDERPLANPNATDDSKYYTQRQIVGMIAACNAGNAVIDNNGKLTVRRFANKTYTLNKNRCFAQEIDTAEQFQVKGILFHVDSENDIFIDDNASEYSEDRDGIIICDNALATVGVAEYVWNKLGNLKYSGCEITRRGIGWLETGETLQVEDFYDAEGGAVNVITSEIDYKFSYDNGFTETIRSVAETAEQSGNRAVAGGTSANTAQNTSNAITKLEYETSRDGSNTVLDAILINGVKHYIYCNPIEGVDTKPIYYVEDENGGALSADIFINGSNVGVSRYSMINSLMYGAITNGLPKRERLVLFDYSGNNIGDEVTGGWTMRERISGVTAVQPMVFPNTLALVQNECPSYCVLETVNKINMSDYSKVVIKCNVQISGFSSGSQEMALFSSESGIGASAASVFGFDNEYSYGTLFEQQNGVQLFILDLSSATVKEGYLGILNYVSSAAENFFSAITVQKIWLEK